MTIILGGHAIVKRFFRVENRNYVEGTFVDKYFEEVNYGGCRRVFQLAAELIDTGLRDIFELKKDKTNYKICQQ